MAGLGWGEGPALLPSAGGVVFSDIDADTLHLWRDGAVRPFRRPSGRANGNTVDRQGRLVSCEHGTRRVSRTGADGRVETVASHWQGRRLNSPNDVVVASDGGIWFTDPPYGLLRGEAEGEAELGFAGVYRADPASGAVELMIDLLDKPNGLAFTLDETRLLVADTGHSHRPGGNRHIFAFDMLAGRPRNLTVFAEILPAACDGLRVDARGNVWSTAGDGIRCLDGAGRETGRVVLGEMTTNLCFLPGEAPALFVTTPTRALVLRFGPGPEPGFARVPA
jgi:gluconolactonase